MSKNTSNLSKQIQAMIVIISFIGGIFSVGYGFIEWVDNRYVNSERFRTMASRTVVAMYDQRIVDLKNHEKYLLEFNHEDTNAIKFVRSQIKEIKEHRRYFLATGHYPIGDEMKLNRYRISKEYD